MMIPPFVVVARTGAPPEPSVSEKWREMLPLTVSGMSVRIPPFTVPVSSRA